MKIAFIKVSNNVILKHWKKVNVNNPGNAIATTKFQIRYNTIGASKIINVIIATTYRKNANLAPNL